MEEVKSRGPYIYSVLESAQAFLSQHPFEELEEPSSENKGLLSSPSNSPFNSPFLVLPWLLLGWFGGDGAGGWCGPAVLGLLP